MARIIIISAIFLGLVQHSLGFHSTPSLLSSRIATSSEFIKENINIPSSSVYLKTTYEDDDFLNSGESYDGEIDWDEEWKKVVKNKDQPKNRPGEYKSEVEIAAAKAKREADAKIAEIQRATPSWSSLKSDPKVSEITFIKCWTTSQVLLH